MTTYIAEIKDVIKFFEKAKEKGFEKVIFSKGRLLQATGLKKYYKLTYTIAPDVFKTKEDISAFIFDKNLPFCGLLVRKENIDKLSEK